MFSQFPKKRIPLPAAFQKIYVAHYQDNRHGNTSASKLSQAMESWMHKKVAKDVQGLTNKSTLEIGAGTLNQLQYENTHPYDIVEPFYQLYEHSVFRHKINSTYHDISEIEDENKYDRITSVATFEHLTDLPAVVAQTCFLLKKGGVLRVAIPNEGTLLWKMGWKLTTGMEFKHRYNLDYAVITRYEHVNTADEIDRILHFFYKDVRCACFGMNKQWAFYRFYECARPEMKHAVQYTGKKQAG